MKNILIALNFFVLVCIGQTITPSVINSGGRSSTATIGSQTVIYTDNIGEAVIHTGTSGGKMITQGFLQPIVVTLNGGVATTFTSNVTCADKGDGVIRVDLDNLYQGPGGVNVKYYWQPNSLCPTNDCSRMDSLSKGMYTVMTVIEYTVGGSAKSETTTSVVEIKDENGICNIIPYTGIHLSGSNSKFTIDNIELYPKAQVCIFNRWGTQLFCTREYSNVDNYWPRKGEKVLPGTYFFVIDAGEKGIIKKWLEVFE